MHIWSVEFWLLAGLSLLTKYCIISTYPFLFNVTVFFTWKKKCCFPLSFFLCVPLFKNNDSLSFYLCCLAVFFHCTDNYQRIQERWVVGSFIFEPGSKSPKNTVHNSARLTIGSSKDHYFLPPVGRGQHPCH